MAGIRELRAALKEAKGRAVPSDLALRCPFCGGGAEVQPWHGGGPDKHMVGCIGVPEGQGRDCEVRPEVTGETLPEALTLWNQRA